MMDMNMHRGCGNHDCGRGHGCGCGCGGGFFGNFFGGDNCIMILVIIFVLFVCCDFC